MILGANELGERISSGGIVVENGIYRMAPLIVSPEPVHIEGVSIDVKLDHVFYLSNQTDKSAYLGVKKRFVPSEIEISFNSDDTVCLYPGYYLVQTVEWINNHIDLVGDIRTRTTLFRSGAILLTSIISPNYQGQLTFGLQIHRVLILERKARIASITFHKVSGIPLLYTGPWQGGKVTAREE
jgi:deoxycytidine triphosphate deaminase